MTTSPAEPVENDQSGRDDSDDDEQSGTGSEPDDDSRSIDDDQLPDELQPRADNPLATPEGDLSEAPKPQEDGAVAEGQPPSGEPSSG